jgi:K+-transporting ATPase ATPase C chain
MKNLFRPAFTLFVLLSFLLGIVYPLVVMQVGRWLFPYQVEGSLVTHKNVIVGSELIGQYFNDPKYFWSRPSATQSFAYNPLASGGSNLGPLNSELLHQVSERVAVLTSQYSTVKGMSRDFHIPMNWIPASMPGRRSLEVAAKSKIPVDLVTTSASGLDPHISIAAALYQVDRVARARQVPAGRIKQLIQQYTERRFLGFIGERRVSVLKLNMALESIQ